MLIEFSKFTKYGYGANYTINRLIYYAYALYQENELEMVMIEIKKIAQIIYNLFLLSKEDLEFIEGVKGMSVEGIDEDVCESVLSNVFNIYKRVCDHPRPIVTDKVH